MISHFAQLVVAVAGLYLITLGVTAALWPPRAKRFLEAHASTARAHFIELTIRLTVGVALILAAPVMRGGLFALLGGWILVVTTLALALMPWRVHQRFAAWSVPMATRSMSLIAAGAIAGGVLVLAALLAGPRGA